MCIELRMGIKSNIKIKNYNSCVWVNYPVGSKLLYTLIFNVYFQREKLYYDTNYKTNID
jgi:hypothetical protein